MAKNAPVKKSKRKLKRSVRRSIAAVLMITAIGVAAVPVPENYAEGPQSRAAAEHVHDMSNLNYVSSAPTAGTTKGAFDETINTGSISPKTINLGLHAGKDIDELVKESGVEVSLATTDLRNGSYDLSWQFMYYQQTEPDSNADRGVICKYNNQYSVELLNLKMEPVTKYYVISEAEYEAYYDAAYTGSYVDDKGTTQQMTHDKVMGHMDNELDPTAKITYSYEQYIGTKVTADKVLTFLQNYCQNTSLYTQTIALFEQYKADLAAWESGSLENEPTKPASYEVTPASVLDANARLSFFCEHDTNLTNKYGSGYTLKWVSDSRPNHSGHVYLAQGGTPVTAQGADNDGNGFLFIGRSAYLMCAIGDQAFKGVDKVVNMVIPDMIGYIGNEAFENATLMESIEIANVSKIGNRAFKGCSKLAKVSLAQGTNIIGAESFSGTAIQSITLPTTVRIVGYGAFANCPDLTSVNVTGSKNDNCVIKDYAFYNCSALNSVQMGDSGISYIGRGAFAVGEGGSEHMGIVLPQSMGSTATVDGAPVLGDSTKNCLGDYLFSGRANLDYVVFPPNYGRSPSPSIKIPDTTFHNCSNLGYVEFPTTDSDQYACGFLTYEPKQLFADVNNTDFYVKGPKLNGNQGDASPRIATWSAVTSYHDEPGFVPYLYYENGVEYYEICSGDYLLCVRRNPDGTGTLISCTLKSDANLDNLSGTLEIPDKVGDTLVVAIETGCFSDTRLTSSVKKLIINDNIKEIAASTFENVNGKWNKLQEATVGSSVEMMGANAFYNCTNLTNITFNTPANYDYTKLDFPGSALHTNGDKLTIHGDIVEGYRPFEYAMDPNTYVKDEQTGIRVCYQSRWDSPSSKHLTVMYGVADKTDEKIGVGKEGYVTLLDYPKYSELEDMDSPAGAELKAHCLEREQQFYEKYATVIYDSKRRAFADAWETATDANEIYNNIQLYGPWINDEFCDDWAKWKTPLASTPGADSYGALDWLLEPLVAEAAPSKDPVPYFDTNSFNFMTNYKKCHGNESEIPRFDDTNELIDYLGWNDFEKQMISSVEDIVIPAGVESIDVSNFYKKNGMNYTTYSTKMEYVVNGDDAKAESTIPGLFSGWIKDYEADDSTGAGYEERGKGIRGNDRIRSVTMTTVLYLPDYAFDNCERLMAVTLGEGMEKVGALPFRDCPELVNLTGNAKYPAENGILYETQTMEPESYKIVECLQGRGSNDPIADRTLTELTDPKIIFVESIDESAFENCDRLSTINLSSATHLTEIQDGTFKDCDSLTYITLPASVNDIKDDAFAGVCPVPGDMLRFTVEIPGSEVSISDNAFGRQEDYVPKILPHFAKERVKILTYKDTAAYRYAVYYAKEQMEVATYPDSENTYSVVFMDYDGTQLGDIQYVVNGFAEVPDTTELKDPNHRPGYAFNDTWLGTNGQDVKKIITANCMFFAQYDSDGTMVNGKYAVEFRDGINGHQLSGRYANPDDGKYYIEPGSSFAEKGWEAPTRESHDDEGFEPLDPNPWSGNWTENTVIDSNMTVIALYRAKNTSGGSTSTPGTGSGGSTTTPSGSTTSSSRNTTSSSNSSSTTSTTSGSDSTVGKYTVTVENGSGSGSYDVGSTVIIAANTPAAGMVFQKWTTESNGVALASVSMTATTFTMPANNVTVTANYVAAPTPVSGSGSNGNTGNTGNTGNGNTRVDITKPGISNKDLATANVNGSTDNFIVKITETDEATRAVQEALTNKYGSLESLLYYAMDISLYDSTGTYKITDTTGLSVDITIPIPDALVMYGGNNMAGAVINGNQLESLNESFTTINGVPCIRFTATHFSPYTIYVDTGNLTEGMLDMTPKTGDPIHPKWFLSIGLACLSIILFMKKDKAAKVKTA